MKKLYVAYGSNLNIAQMALRCPTAHIYGTGLRAVSTEKNCDTLS